MRTLHYHCRRFGFGMRSIDFSTKNASSIHTMDTTEFKIKLIAFIKVTSCMVWLPWELPKIALRLSPSSAHTTRTQPQNAALNILRRKHTNSRETKCGRRRIEITGFHCAECGMCVCVRHTQFLFQRKYLLGCILSSSTTTILYSN